MHVRVLCILSLLLACKKLSLWAGTKKWLKFKAARLFPWYTPTRVGGHTWWTKVTTDVSTMSLGFSIYVTSVCVCVCVREHNSVAPKHMLGTGKQLWATWFRSRDIEGVCLLGCVCARLHTRIHCALTRAWCVYPSKHARIHTHRHSEGLLFCNIWWLDTAGIHVYLRPVVWHCNVLLSCGFQASIGWLVFIRCPRIVYSSVSSVHACMRTPPTHQ